MEKVGELAVKEKWEAIMKKRFARTNQSALFGIE